MDVYIEYQFYDYLTKYTGMQNKVISPLTPSETRWQLQSLCQTVPDYFLYLLKYCIYIWHVPLYTVVDLQVKSDLPVILFSFDSVIYIKLLKYMFSTLKST